MELAVCAYCGVYGATEEEHAVPECMAPAHLKSECQLGTISDSAAISIVYYDEADRERPVGWCFVGNTIDRGVRPDEVLQRTRVRRAGDH